tara:strand:- start:105 stop:605 length:501 start_codon:yes stop_codon:yes gene_type:complete
MAETKYVLKGLVVKYNGLFNIKAFYKFLDKFFKDYGYDKNEKVNEEKTHKGGKDIFLKLEPFRIVSDYAKNFIEVKVSMKDIKEVEIVKDDKKIKMNDGTITIDISCYLKTDLEGRWEQKPIFVFLRTLIDKFVYKFYLGNMEADLAKDTKELYHSIKSFLNLYKY